MHFFSKLTEIFLKMMSQVAVTSIIRLIYLILQQAMWCYYGNAHHRSTRLLAVSLSVPSNSITYTNITNAKIDCKVMMVPSGPFKMDLFNVQFLF